MLQILLLRQISLMEVVQYLNIALSIFRHNHLRMYGEFLVMWCVGVEHLVIDFMIHWLRRLVKVGKPNDIKGYNFEVVGSLDIETQG